MGAGIGIGVGVGVALGVAIDNVGPGPGVSSEARIGFGDLPSLFFHFLLLLEPLEAHAQQVTNCEHRGEAEKQHS